MISLPLPEGNFIKNIIHISDIHIRLGDRKTSRYDEYDSVFNNLYEDIKDKCTIYTIIIITGDIFHNKNRIDNYGILLFNKLLGLLSKLSPVYIIQGNHDYQQHLSKDEPDILEASLEYITKYNNTNNIFYLKNTGHYIANNIGFGLVSIKDALKEGDTCGKVSELPIFPDIKLFPSTVKTYIALFHGNVSNHFSIANYKSSNSGYPLEWFKDYDIALLGDTHLQQINDATLLENNIYSFDNKKTWAYSGSLIQQNYGEPLYNHGYLEWNLENKIVTPYHIYNPIGYVKISTLDELDILLNNKNCPEFLYIRNNYSIKKEDITDILLKYNKKASIIFNHEFIKNKNEIKNNEIKNNDIIQHNSLNSLIEYISSNLSVHSDNIEWKEWIINPCKLLITDKIDSLNDIIDTRNKLLTKNIDSYNNVKDIHNILHKTLNLEYMDWGWLLCFKNNNWFNFNSINDNNIAIINSPNGYGKSSFLEIICLSLFGESIPSRYSKSYSSSIICQKIPENEKAYTNIQFKINNELYKIHRKFDYKFNDKTKIDNYLTELYRYSYDTENNIETKILLHRGKTAVQSWISLNIGTIDTFLLSTMITQNTDNDFFSMKSIEQNNIIDNSLNLDAVNNIAVVFKEIIKSYKFIKTNASSVYNHLNNNISCDITQDILDDYKNKINSFTDEKNIYLMGLNSLNINHNYDLNDINKSEEEINNILKEHTNNLKPFTLNKTIEQLYEDKGSMQITKPENMSDDISDISDEYYNKISLKYQEHLNNKPNSSLKNLLELKELFENIINDYGTYNEFKKIIIDNYILIPPVSVEEINKKFIKYQNINKDIYNSINENMIVELKQNIEDYKKIIIIYNKLDSEHLILLENSIKKPDINLDEIKKFTTSYSRCCKNKELLINKINVYNKLLDIKNNINKYKNHDYNDNCWVCKKQLWKIELDDLKIKKDELEKEYKITEKQHDNNIIKLKYIIDNENKYTEYNKLKNTWKEYDIWYDKYKKIKEKLNKIDVSKDKLYEKLDKLYEKLEYYYILKELNEYSIHKENWIKYNNYNDMINISNKIPDEYKNGDICDIEKDIEWYNIKIKIENDLNIIKYKKYLEIIENINTYNLNEKILYWNNIIKTKPCFDIKKNLELKISDITNKLNIITQEYYKKISLYDDYINKKNDLLLYKNFIENLNIKLEILENITTKFSSYRSWLYKEKIIPKIIDYTNSIIENITDKHLRLDASINDDCTIQWCFQDGTNRPIIEKASGFQKFILGMSIRIALSNLAGMKCNQLFIDEGFVACDTEHLSKVPNFLINLLNIYNNVILVSHLESIKEMNATQVNIIRKNDLSKIQFGSKI